MAKGYNQKESLDYGETFSPMAKMLTVRSIIALVAYKQWLIFQMDVHNIFLNGDLIEEVYMHIPERFSIHGETHKKVYKLHKSLYGLKHPPRKWNIKLIEALLYMGFKQNHYDYSFFYKEHCNDIVVILVYVDDLLITGNNHQLLCETRTNLKKKFKMKDLRELKFFLGIEFARSKKGVLMC